MESPESHYTRIPLVRRKFDINSFHCVLKPKPAWMFSWILQSQSLQVNGKSLTITTLYNVHFLPLYSGTLLFDWRLRTFIVSYVKSPLKNWLIIAFHIFCYLLLLERCSFLYPSCPTILISSMHRPFAILPLVFMPSIYNVILVPFSSSCSLEI